MSIETERNPTKLRLYIEKNKMRMIDFARLSKVPVATIHQIFHGKRVPRERTAKKICKATHFAITLADFGLE